MNERTKGYLFVSAVVLIGFALLVFSIVRDARGL